MNNDERENRLKEAAEKIINKHGSPEIKVSKIYEFGINMFVEGAKSEAAKEYHSAQSKEAELPTDEEINAQDLNKSKEFLELSNWEQVIYKHSFNAGAKWMRDTYMKQPSKDVDLTELREQWNNKIKNTPDFDRSYSNTIWNFFLPYITQQPAEQKSDAGEFSEWCFIYGWKFHPEVGDKGIWRNEKGIVLIESPTSPLYVNTNRLYQEFLTTQKQK